MDTLERYRTCIQTLLERQGQYKTQDDEVENALFFDPVRDRYQLIRVGWRGLDRVYHTVSRMDEVWKIPLNPRQSFYLGKPQDHAASPS